MFSHSHLSLTYLFTLLCFLLSSNSQSQTQDLKLNTELKTYTEKMVDSFGEIDSNRRESLDIIAEGLSYEYLATYENKEENTGKVVFVCSHNCRRSQTAELWYKFAAHYYGLKNFESYSCGLDESEFNELAIAANKRAGFKASYLINTPNPVVTLSPGGGVSWNFQSKRMYSELNPKGQFVAIMVCSESDQSCPNINGAVDRFSLPYENPNQYDGTHREEEAYDELIETIGREMLYLVNTVNQNLESAK